MIAWWLDAHHGREGPYDSPPVQAALNLYLPRRDRARMEAESQRKLFKQHPETTAKQSDREEFQ